MIRRILVFTAIAAAGLALVACLAAPVFLWGSALKVVLWSATGLGLGIAILLFATFPAAPAAPEDTAAPRPLSAIDFDQPWKGRQ